MNDKAEQLLQESGLDFEFLELQLAGINGANEDGQPKAIVSPYKGIYNPITEKFVNATKEGYNLIQNRTIVENVVKGLENFEGDIFLNKIISVNEGSKMFLQLGIDGFSKVGDDHLKKYITIVESKDGSSSFAALIDSFTLSCKNQQGAILSNAQLKAKHTASLSEKMRLLPQMIKTGLEDHLRTIEIYNELARSPLTAKLTDDLVKYIVGTDRSVSSEDLAKVSTRKRNAMECLYGHIQKETAQKGGNLWGLFSGVTSWTTHDKSAPVRNNGRIESSLIGTNAVTNKKAFNFCTANL